MFSIKDHSGPEGLFEKGIEGWRGGLRPCQPFSFSLATQLTVLSTTNINGIRDLLGLSGREKVEWNRDPAHK